MKHRTLAYWSTRIMLAIGVIATADVVLLAPLLAAPSCFSCNNPAVLGLPSALVLAVVAVTLAVVGLIWMVRIVRGPRDEPPDWRYRDR